MPSPKSSSRYLRITNAGKTPGVFLTAQIITPPQQSQLKMGKIYAILEISHPTTRARQIGQTIINTLKHSYFQDDSTSDMQNLEKALKNVNETLAQIAQSGETDWIGNMNAVFCLLVDNEAHLATTGRAQAWLIREGRISEIVDSQAQPLQPHPLKTFSSLTSGSLVSGDRLILANPKLQNHLSSQDIKEMVDRPALQEVGEELIKTLRKAKEKSISLFVIESCQERSAQQPQGIDLYLDQPTETPLNQAIKFSKKYLVPWAVRTSQQAAGYFKSSVKLTKTKILPQSRQFLKTAGQKSQKLVKDYTTKAKPILRQAHTKTKRLVFEKLAKKQPHPEEAYKGANIIGRPIYTINDYKIDHPTGAKRIFRQIISAVKKTLHSLDNQIYHLSSWLSKKKKHPLILLIGALMLIIILIVSISFQRKRQTEKAAAEQQRQILEASQQKLEQGRTALVFADKETAALLFEETIELAERLSGTEYKDAAEKIINQAVEQSDSLTQTTRIRQIEPFAENLSARLLFVYQGDAFILSDKSPEIVKVNILSGDKDIVNKIESDKGSWQQVVRVDDRHFYLLTDKGNIYDFNAQEESLKKIELKDKQLKKAVDLDIFNNNLYLLSPEDSQVWKYLPAEAGGYQDPIKYAQTSLAKTLKKSQALAIDGAIYALAEGKIVKMSRGTEAGFKIKNLPKAFEDLSQAVDIFTAENIPSIYLLDKTRPRIVELDKNGNYIHQYLLPSFIKDPQSFQIDHIGKKAWILANDKGYEIDL
jgi:hypothetical protein